MDSSIDHSSAVDKRIYNLIQLPDAVSLMQDIPVETMLNQGVFNNKQKEDIRANVKEIKLLYNITSQKSNKASVRSGLSDYSEIQIISLKLISHDFYKYAFHHFLWPIFRAVPYPMVILAFCDKGIEPVVRIAADVCRDNKFDDSLNVVDHIKSTCWIGLNRFNDDKDCNIQLCGSFGRAYGMFDNLKDIYELWISEIARHYATFYYDETLNRNEFTYISNALAKYSTSMDKNREYWLYERS